MQPCSVRDFDPLSRLKWLLKLAQGHDFPIKPFAVTSICHAAPVEDASEELRLSIKHARTDRLILGVGVLSKSQSQRRDFPDAPEDTQVLD